MSSKRKILIIVFIILCFLISLVIVLLYEPTLNESFESLSISQSVQAPQKIPITGHHIVDNDADTILNSNAMAEPDKASLKPTNDNVPKQNLSSGQSIQGYGNISNWGLAASGPDGQQYFSNDAIFLIPAGQEVTSAEMVYDMPGWYMNVVEDGLVFVNPSDHNRIYRLSLQQGTAHCLSLDNARFLNVYGESAYYVNESKNNHLYKLNIKTGEQKCLYAREVDYLCLSEERLFFSSVQEGILCSINIDGLMPQILCTDQASYINVYNGYLYYSNAADEHRIYRIRTDGTEREKICSDSAKYVNVAYGTLYYYTAFSDRCIYSLTLENSNKAEIINDHCTSINIIADKMYYCNTDGDSFGRYFMNLDGSERVKIN